MTPAMAGKLQDLVSQRKWDAAFELLQGLAPTAAADLIMGLRFEEQQLLFRQLPVPLAASILNHLPYFHAYVLLHSRPVQEMAAILDAMSQGDRDHFLDALPEEAWKSLTDELSEVPSGGAPESSEVSEAAREQGVAPQPAADEKTIIEARQIEKSFPQKDGSEI